MVASAVRLVSPAAVMAAVPTFLLVYLFSVPHYGATLTLVYESPESRSRYFRVSVYGSLLILILFAATLYSPLAGSLVLTLYLTWSPWHYTGQNYGILLTLLARRGARPDAALKRWIHVSFISSFGLALLSIHGTAQGNYAPVSYGGSAYQLIPIPIPAALSGGLVALVGGVYLFSTAVSVVRIRKQVRLSGFAPGLLLFFLQASWFSLPVVLRQWTTGTVDEARHGFYSGYGFVWIAAAHAVQYLWFCAYYAKRSSAATPPLAFLGKSILAGFAVWALPALVLGPALLDAARVDANFALMVAAVVNLHHFVLDGTIWKRRDGRIARVLFPSSATSVSAPSQPARDAEAETTSFVGRGRNRYLAAVAVLGAVGLLSSGVEIYESRWGFQRAIERDGLARASASLNRLAWFGTDSFERRIELGRRYARAGDFEASGAELQASLELKPTAEAWRWIAYLKKERGNPAGALAAYGRALDVEPQNVPVMLEAASFLLSQGRPRDAVKVLETAARLQPNRTRVEEMLAIARQAAGTR